MTDTVIHAAVAEIEASPAVAVRRQARSDLSARGEPYVWIMGAALVAGLAMITGFLAFVMYFGAVTFWPQPVEVVALADGKTIAGEVFRTETYKPPEEQLAQRPPAVLAQVAANNGV